MDYKRHAYQNGTFNEEFFFLYSVFLDLSAYTDLA